MYVCSKNTKMNCDNCLLNMRLPYTTNCGHSLCITCTVGLLQNNIGNNINYNNKCPFCHRFVTNVLPNYNLRRTQQRIMGDEYIIMTSDERITIETIKLLTHSYEYKHQHTTIHNVDIKQQTWCYDNTSSKRHHYHHHQQQKQKQKPLIQSTDGNVINNNDKISSLRVTILNYLMGTGNRDEQVVSLDITSWYGRLGSAYQSLDSGDFALIRGMGPYAIFIISLVIAYALQ